MNTEAAREAQYRIVLERLAAEERPRPSVKAREKKNTATVSSVSSEDVPAHDPVAVRAWLSAPAEDAKSGTDFFAGRKAPSKKDMWNADIPDGEFDADAEVPTRATGLQNVRAARAATDYAARPDARDIRVEREEAAAQFAAEPLPFARTKL